MNSVMVCSDVHSVCLYSFRKTFQVEPCEVFGIDRYEDLASTGATYEHDIEDNVCQVILDGDKQPLEEKDKVKQPLPPSLSTHTHTHKQTHKCTPNPQAHIFATVPTGEPKG